MHGSWISKIPPPPSSIFTIPIKKTDEEKGWASMIRKKFDAHNDMTISLINDLQAKVRCLEHSWEVRRPHYWTYVPHIQSRSAAWRIFKNSSMLVNVRYTALVCGFIISIIFQFDLPKRGSHLVIESLDQLSFLTFSMPLWKTNELVCWKFGFFSTYTYSL